MYKIERSISPPDDPKPPSKYAFWRLKYGDSFFIPASSDRIELERERLRLLSAASKHRKRSDPQFKIVHQVEAGGIRVWCVRHTIPELDARDYPVFDMKPGDSFVLPVITAKNPHDVCNVLNAISFACMDLVREKLGLDTSFVATREVDCTRVWRAKETWVTGEEPIEHGKHPYFDKASLLTAPPPPSQS